MSNAEQFQSPSEIGQPRRSRRLHFFRNVSGKTLAEAMGRTSMLETSNSGITIPRSQQGKGKVAPRIYLVQNVELRRNQPEVLRELVYDPAMVVKMARNYPHLTEQIPIRFQAASAARYNHVPDSAGLCSVDIYFDEKTKTRLGTERADIWEALSSTLPPDHPELDYIPYDPHLIFCYVERGVPPSVGESIARFAGKQLTATGAILDPMIRSRTLDQCKRLCFDNNIPV